jgi:hypothetical protein
LYCKDGKKHEFKVGQTLNVNACGDTGGTSDGCPKVTDGTIYCNFKFADASKISGYPITVDSWTACQRKCWDHGESCRGWYYKDKKCTLSTKGDKKDMKSAKGYMGGPRRDVNAGPIVTSSDGEAPVDTSANVDTYVEDSYGDEGETEGIKQWLQENKTMAIAGVLIVLLFSFAISAGFAMVMFM